MSLSSNIEKVFAIFLGQCLFLSFSEIQYRAGFVGIVGLKQWIKIFKIFIKGVSGDQSIQNFYQNIQNIYQNIQNIYQNIQNIYQNILIFIKIF